MRLICSANKKILSVNAKQPGSTHDSYIWNNLNVSTAMQEICRRYPGNYYFLGDSEYALRPLRNAVDGTPEANYNKCHSAIKSIIEKVNGVLKARFQCLLKHRVLHYDPETAGKIIKTCCVLPNMCGENNLARCIAQIVQEKHSKGRQLT